MVFLIEAPDVVRPLKHDFFTWLGDIENGLCVVEDFYVLFGIKPDLRFGYSCRWLCVIEHFYVIFIFKRNAFAGL